VSRPRPTPLAEGPHGVRYAEVETTTRFQVGPHRTDYLDVTLDVETGQLKIRSGEGQLVVEPLVSNVIQVYRRVY